MKTQLIVKQVLVIEEHLGPALPVGEHLGLRPTGEHLHPVGEHLRPVGEHLGLRPTGEHLHPVGEHLRPVGEHLGLRSTGGHRPPVGEHLGLRAADQPVGEPFFSGIIDEHLGLRTESMGSLGGIL